MKTETSSLDLHYIIREMQFLIGGKVDKIYQEQKNMLLQLHVPSKGKQLMSVMAPGYFYLSSKKPEFQNPGGFCMFLRKYLENTRVRSIRQAGFERIVEIEFESKDAKYLMIIELFSKGNIILCREDYIIMSALESKKWSERTVRGGVKYEFPEKRYNLLKISEEDLRKAIDESEKESIVKTLAIDLGLGGVYSEEICLIAGVDKSKKTLGKKDVESLYTAIKEITEKKIEAIVKESDAYPFRLSKTKDAEHFETFNAAIDSIITPKVAARKSEEADSKQKQKIEKTKDIISMQEKRILEMQKQYEELQKTGEMIYENYTEIKAILEELRKAKEKYSWHEIKEKLKGHRIIKDINEKEQKAIVEI